MHFVRTEAGYVEVDRNMVDGELPRKPGPKLGIFNPDDLSSQHPDPQHWHDGAAEEKEAAGWRCRACNDDFNLQAHHRTYERYGHELPEDVTCLCGKCHKVFHCERRLAA